MIMLVTQMKYSYAAPMFAKMLNAGFVKPCFMRQTANATLNAN